MPTQETYCPTGATHKKKMLDRVPFLVHEFALNCALGSQSVCLSVLWEPKYAQVPTRETKYALVPSHKNSYC